VGARFGDSWVFLRRNCDFGGDWPKVNGRLDPEPNPLDCPFGFGARNTDIVQLPVVQLLQIALPFLADAVSPRRVYQLIQRILRMI